MWVLFLQLIFGSIQKKNVILYLLLTPCERKRPDMSFAKRFSSDLRDALKPKPLLMLMSMSTVFSIIAITIQIESRFSFDPTRDIPAEISVVETEEP